MLAAANWVRYILILVPGSFTVLPDCAPEVVAQIDEVNGSPFLMILAAAPDPPVTFPLTLTRVVPAGHFPLIV